MTQRIYKNELSTSESTYSVDEIVVKSRIPIRIHFGFTVELKACGNLILISGPQKNCVDAATAFIKNAFSL